MTSSESKTARNINGGDSDDEPSLEGGPTAREPHDTALPRGGNQEESTEEVITESVQKGILYVQELARSGKAGDWKVIYAGIEGGRLSEETLKRLFVLLGTPDVRTLPETEVPSHLRPSWLGRRDTLHQFDTGRGILLAMIESAPMDNGDCVVTLQAHRV